MYVEGALGNPVVPLQKMRKEVCVLRDKDYLFAMLIASGIRSRRTGTKISKVLLEYWAHGVTFYTDLDMPFNCRTGAHFHVFYNSSWWYYYTPAGGVA